MNKLASYRDPRVPCFNLMVSYLNPKASSFRQDVAERCHVKLSEHDVNLSEGNVNLSERNVKLSESDVNLSEHDVNLSERDVKLSESNVNLSEHDVNLSEGDVKLSEINVMGAFTELCLTLFFRKEELYLPFKIFPVV